MLGLPRKNIAALLLVAAFVGAYSLWRYTLGEHPPELERVPVEVARAYDDWAAPLLPRWSSAVITPLSNELELREKVRILIHKAAESGSLEVSIDKKEALTKCLADFFPRLVE